MNASELAKKWLKLVQPKNRNFNFSKWCGYIQRLLKKYNSREIKEAMETFHYHYPFSGIESFSYNCGRIIKYNRSKKSRSNPKL